MRQRWRDLLFLHWPVPPEWVQRSLPPGLTVDLFQGHAYIGLVPFRMQGVRPVWSPSVPGLSDFLECNVRTYVHRGGAGPGVWFYSLDAANPIAVLLARTLWKLPYFHARMQVERASRNIIDYKTARLYPPPTPASTAVRYAPTGAPSSAEPGSLEHFLVERYILYAYARGRLWRGRVHHSPYPLQSAGLDTLEDTLVAAAGFPVREVVSARPSLVHYAAGVDVDVFPLRPLA